jgi:acyl-CoA synthetase (AMP-forming)/AMP-acid ligase II
VGVGKAKVSRFVQYNAHLKLFFLIPPAAPALSEPVLIVGRNSTDWIVADLACAFAGRLAVPVSEGATGGLPGARAAFVAAQDAGRLLVGSRGGIAPIDSVETLEIVVVLSGGSEPVGSVDAVVAALRGRFRTVLTLGELETSGGLVPIGEFLSELSRIGAAPDYAGDILGGDRTDDGPGDGTAASKTVRLQRIFGLDNITVWCRDATLRVVTGPRVASHLCVTSGTSGTRPKIVVVSAQQAMAELASVCGTTAASSAIRWRISVFLPLTHESQRDLVRNMIVRCGTVAVLERPPAHIFQALGLYEPNFVAGVPRIWAALHELWMQAVAKGGGSLSGLGFAVFFMIF